MEISQFIPQIRDLIARDEIPAALESMQAMLGKNPKLNDAIHQSGRFYNIKREMMRGTVSHAEATLTQNQIRFGLLDLLSEIEQNGVKSLPKTLAYNLLAHRNPSIEDDPDGPIWVQSLREELQEIGVSVGRKPKDIFRHYGWLIEVNLLKMMTTPDDADAHPPLRQLSYMAEAFQSSLRYLCYIQVSQILPLNNQGSPQAEIAEFLQLKEKQHLHYDHLSLLCSTTECMPDPSFVPEIAALVAEFLDRDSTLCQAAMFLDKQRTRLLQNEIAEDEHLDALLDEYLTGLIFWLRRLVFLANYRLVSIKDIHLSYRLGNLDTWFVHLFSDLHGIYSPTGTTMKEYNTQKVKGVFTYNQSVLLFKGNDVEACLKQIQDSTTYISLSPLVLDQSVFANKETQTPEIYCFIGNNPNTRQYDYAEFKNELVLGEREQVASNKFMQVKAQNTQQPKLNELYKHIEQVFKPFKTASA